MRNHYIADSHIFTMTERKREGVSEGAGCEKEGKEEGNGGYRSGGSVGVRGAIKEGK